MSSVIDKLATLRPLAPYTAISFKIRPIYPWDSTQGTFLCGVITPLWVLNLTCYVVSTELMDPCICWLSPFLLALLHLSRPAVNNTCLPMYSTRRANDERRRCVVCLSIPGSLLSLSQHSTLTPGNGSSISLLHRSRSSTTTCLRLSFLHWHVPNLVRPCHNHRHFGRLTRRYEECGGRRGGRRR